MVIVQCACGAKFTAKPNLAGKTLSCLRCGAAITVPKPKPKPPSDSGNGEPITVRCQCQKAFQAPRKLAGKRVACPNCKSPIQVPAGVPYRVPASRPKLDAPADVFDGSAESLPASRKTKRLGKSQANYYKMLAVVAVVVILTSVVIIEAVQRIGVSDEPSVVSVATNGTGEFDSGRSSSVGTNGSAIESESATGISDSANKSVGREDRLEQAHAALPVSVADMLERYQMHGDSTANRNWDAVAARLYNVQFRSAASSLPHYVERLNGSSAQRVRTLVRSHAPTNNLLKKAVDYEGQIEFVVAKHDMNVRLVQAHLLAMRYLQLSAFSQLQNDEIDGCKESLLLMLMVQEKFKRCPHVKEQISRFSRFRFCRNIFGALLARDAFTKEELNQWREVFARTDPRQDARHTICGEYARAIYGYDHLDEVEMPEKYRSILSLSDPKRTKDRAFTKKLMARTLYAIDLPIAEARQELNATERELLSTDTFLSRMTYTMSFWFFPAVEVFYEWTLRTQLVLDQVDLAIAIELYRKDNSGAFPSPLRSLVPTYIDKIPVDPFGGVPIEMTIQGDSYYLYARSRPTGESFESAAAPPGKFGERMNEMWMKKN